jgi:hypothetical protein
VCVVVPPHTSLQAPPSHFIFKVIRELLDVVPSKKPRARVLYERFISWGSDGVSTHKRAPSEALEITTLIGVKAQNLMMQYVEYMHHNPPVNESRTSPVDGHHYLDSPKVWERIVSHPQFDEVDIEQLCTELDARLKIVPATPHSICFFIWILW